MNVEKPTFKKICKMYIQQLTNFPYIEKDFDALTDYGLLCKVVDYLNQVIENNNTQNESITNLYNAFVALKEYVDNLDLQDEVNNKLDEMASDGTLDEIISRYVGSECEYIFPGRWGLNGSGNSNIIKLRDKTILFDTNGSSVYSYLKQMLTDENITHLDYVIISHFDGDHRGNFQNLIDDGYIDNNTIYIHPHALEGIYTESVINWYNNIEQECEELGITSIVPEENQVITVDTDFSMRFGNLDEEYAIQNYTNPNQACMVVECKHNNFYSLFMGDALKEAQQYLFNTNFIKNEIQLYGIPHHAIEHNCNLQFYNTINPKIAVAQSQMGDFNLTIFSYNQDSAILYEKGCTNYYSFNNSTNIKFKEKMGVISCVNGIPTEHSGNSFEIANIYCDSENYNQYIQNGTQEYPFKDLVQALGIVPDFNNKPIEIHLAPGHYGNSYTGSSSLSNNVCQVLNRKNFIKIIGEDKDTTIIDNGILIINSYRVRIDNVTIKPARTNKCVRIENSNVYFRDCNFVGRDDETKVSTGLASELLSTAQTISCNFDNLDNAYSCTALGTLYTYNDYINDVNKMIYHENGVKINIGKLNSNTDFSTIDALDNYNSSKSVFSKNYKVNIPITDIMTGNITLPFRVNNVYKFMEIDYDLRLNGVTAGRGKEIIPFEVVASYLISNFNAKGNNGLTMYTMLINITSTQIQISRNTCIEVASNGTMTLHNPSQADDTSYGIKITNISLY